ncbi:MAG: hypothetical protein IT559_05090 [Alphaproteobacteria bacterium]|nr:hypothetical protein [Alphaproteobacteria bacterium]
MVAGSALSNTFDKDAAGVLPSLSAWQKLKKKTADLFNQKALPPGWKSHKMSLSTGEKNEIFYSPAKNPEATAIYISGLQSSPLEHISEIETLNNHGISVISFSLLPATPNELAGQNVKYMKRNTTLFSEALFDPTSKIHKLGDKTLPRYILPHSTASLVLQYALAQNGNAEKAADLFDGAINLNPFLDADGASQRHDPFKSWLYKHFAAANATTPVMTSRIEKLIMGNETTYKDYFFAKPTHGLIHGILDRARPFVNKVLKEGLNHNISLFPQSVILGKEDGMVSKETAEEFARAVNAKVITYPIDHGSALTHRDSLNGIIEALKAPGPRLAPEAASSTIQPPPVKAEMNMALTVR